MFYTENKKNRTYFVGRRMPKGVKGLNILYSVPVSKRRKKASRLTLSVGNTRLDLNGREVLQLRRVLTKAQRLQKEQ
jgi:hypothetical protein